MSAKEQVAENVAMAVMITFVGVSSVIMTVIMVAVV